MVLLHHLTTVLSGWKRLPEAREERRTERGACPVTAALPRPAVARRRAAQGSDAEAVASEPEGTSGPAELTLAEPAALPQEDDQQEQPAAWQTDFGQGDVSSVVESHSVPETAKPEDKDKKGGLPEDSSCVGAISDDSDIVTLETPRVEEVGSQEEAVPPAEEAQVSEDFNMGSSTSSRYTFCQPETAFPPPCPSGEESSSDETSHRSSPALRRRRAKKRLISSSESEEAPPREQEPEPAQDQWRKHHFSGGLNRCITLALVIAISMGFGHFYGKLEGTVQIQKRQQLVEKTHEDELTDVRDHLIQCQREQGVMAVGQSLKEGLAACLLNTELEKRSCESQKHLLSSENQRLRASLEREESALALLQEELRKLREQIRHLENAGPSQESPVATENQKLRAHLEEEKHRMQHFMKQKETWLLEAQMLRRELDKERHLTVSLREELEKLSAQQVTPGAGAGDGLQESQEIEALQGRLAELEKKLSFEQQRSDLWEKLYVEVKDNAEKQEQVKKSQAPTGKGANKAKRKQKATFLGSVKETLDAMKNSTKEFVRHHKEKIKQAKEAVKENLRKFSDSVKSTFRHFKDTTKNIFEREEKKKHGDRRQEANRKGKVVYQADGSHEGLRSKAPGSQRDFRDGKRSRERPHVLHLPKDPPTLEVPRGPMCNKKRHTVLKGCTDIFDCAHQEFVSLFNKVMDPIRADEFNQLMHKYLQQEVGNFHHWRELEDFVERFFHNGVFIHDQMLFTDFVNDVKDYLEDLKEYQRGSDGVFDDLDKYIYRYYFHYDPSPQHAPSHPRKRAPFTHTQSPSQERHAPKHQQRYKREGRWQKQGSPNGRHMANLEIEVGQLPFDPKY
ncbi:cell cycle progression protein 1 isoform X3 [Varanus komodoensis]|uniref:cell cycle progression protein 1 isoform X3 n=1 Tax=Varanus komodoensis TaxID=61221 RepID=UPI001CF7A2D9|nr:cell cycle progression protein 1 isoform X3 [Varanus komodoensis]